MSTAVLLAALTHGGEEVDCHRPSVLLKVLQTHNPKEAVTHPLHHSTVHAYLVGLANTCNSPEHRLLTHKLPYATPVVLTYACRVRCCPLTQS